MGVQTAQRAIAALPVMPASAISWGPQADVAASSGTSAAFAQLSVVQGKRRLTNEDCSDRTSFCFGSFWQRRAGAQPQAQPPHASFDEHARLAERGKPERDGGRSDHDEWHRLVQVRRQHARDHRQAIKLGWRTGPPRQTLRPFARRTGRSDEARRCRHLRPISSL